MWVESIKVEYCTHERDRENEIGTFSEVQFKLERLNYKELTNL